MGVSIFDTTRPFCWSSQITSDDGSNWKEVWQSSQTGGVVAALIVLQVPAGGNRLQIHNFGDGEFPIADVELLATYGDGDQPGEDILAKLGAPYAGGIVVAQNRSLYLRLMTPLEAPNVVNVQVIGGYF